MNVEEEIKKCEGYLKQIKQYDPDPFYVDYFFNKLSIELKKQSKYANVESGKNQ